MASPVVGSFVSVFVPFGPALEPRLSGVRRVVAVSCDGVVVSAVAASGHVSRFFRLPGSDRFVACPSLASYIPAVSAFFLLG